MAPEVPKIAQDIIDWFRGRRGSNVTHLGDMLTRKGEGYRPPDYGGKGFSGRSPTSSGYAPFAKKETGDQTGRDTGYGSSIGEGGSRKLPPGTGHAAFAGKGTEGQLGQDAGSESIAGEGISGVVRAGGNYTPYMREGAAGQMGQGAGDESLTGEKGAGGAPASGGYTPYMRKGASGQMDQGAGDESLTGERGAGGALASGGYTPYMREGAAGQMDQDTGDESPIGEGSSGGVAEGGGYTPYMKKETKARMGQDSGSKSPEEKAVDSRVLSEKESVSSKEQDGVIGQRNLADHGESEKGEMSDESLSIGEDGNTVTKGKGPDEQNISGVDSDISRMGEVASGQTSPDMSDVYSKQEATHGAMGPEIADKMTGITSNREVYKEGQMNDAHFVARDNNESNLVQRLHPGCNVIIPTDYEEAIEEIKTCPLSCPYKALEFTELDQRTLRGRMK